MNFNSLVEKARTSGFYLFLLNRLSARMIPFNKPHKFRIVEIEQHRIKTKIPYIRSNFNHLKGLHATALATLAEMTSGFLLITNLDPSKYRLILARLEVDYFYQGKTDGFAVFSMSEEDFNEKIYSPLQNEESILVQCPVEIYDTKNNHLATGTAHWQVKSWENVKTKV